MSALMPQGSYRWCKRPSCARRWYTAHPHAMACPYCGEMCMDATDGWPHVCGRGHGAQHAGECMECRVEVGR